jgi:effector-binding domain-containing protein/uncharacterized protein YndB with AHSA1/START domain
MVEDMMRKIVIGVAAFVVMVVGVAFLLPSTARVERSQVIKATPEEIFAVVNDLTRFKDWTAWGEMDPKMKITLDGPPTGAGARMSWASEALGAGSQQIVESTPFKLVTTKLDFGDAGEASTSMSLEPVDGGTKVVWVFETELGMNPVSRYMGLMIDGQVGGDFDRGLSRLKALVEPQDEAEVAGGLGDGSSAGLAPDMLTPADADPDKGPEVVSVASRTVIRTRGSAAVADDTALSAALGEAYNKILMFAEQNALEIGGGAPQAVTLSNENGVWAFEAAMPLVAKPEAELVEVEGVTIGTSYGGRAIKVTHKGPYSTLNKAYERLRAHAREKGLKETGVVWEEYVGDPAEMGDEALLTNVYIGVE